MEKVPLALWMIGWPLAYDAGQYLDFKRGKQNAPASGSVLVVWIVGILILWPWR